MLLFPDLFVISDRPTISEEGWMLRPKVFEYSLVNSAPKYKLAAE